MANELESLELPPFPPELAGQRGALLAPAVLDPEIGSEICLVLFEPDLTWRRFLADADLGLDLSAGVVRLPQGAVAFFAWSVWLDDADLLDALTEEQTGEEEMRYLTAYLGLLDPHDPSTRALLAAAGAQERLPAVLLDSRQGRVLELLEFGNDYGLDELAEAFAAEVEDEPEGSFALAAEEFRRRYPVETLVGTGPDEADDEAEDAPQYHDEGDDEEYEDTGERLLPDEEPPVDEPV